MLTFADLTAYHLRDPGKGSHACQFHYGPSFTFGTREMDETILGPNLINISCRIVYTLADLKATHIPRCSKSSQRTVYQSNGPIPRR